MKSLPSLHISVVSYAPDMPLLQKTLKSAFDAIQLAKDRSLLRDVYLTIVDNGPERIWQDKLQHLCENMNAASDVVVQLVSGHGNIGYGAGHNLAIFQVETDYHLILNPDVVMHETALVEALVYLGEHDGTGLLTPLARDERGHKLYLCKRFPTLFVLLLRAMPVVIRRSCVGYADAYEMHENQQDDVCVGLSIVSGCFMLFRRDVLLTIDAFDEKFFLYFEDFDLSLRAAQCCDIAYVPDVQIVHYGGGASKKGFKHIQMFGLSAWQFFSKHGWKLW